MKIYGQEELAKLIKELYDKINDEVDEKLAYKSDIDHTHDEFQINYSALEFDTSEIVFDSDYNPGDDSEEIDTSAVLGKAQLNRLILK